MSYYPTLTEDVERAKAIVAKGKPAHDEVAYLPTDTLRAAALAGGTIYGADVYAAHKLLESLADATESYLLLLAVLDADDFKHAMLKLGILTRQEAARVEG